MKESVLLGILGGLGPMSTVYFYEMLTSHTEASSDQEHLNMIISSHASTPDRTGFITGRSAEDPFPVMVSDAERLVEYGADLIAIPCNTAHYFYSRLQESVKVPILNIIEETVSLLKRVGISCVGVLATEGTICSGSYMRVCAEHGIRCEVPDADGQAALMDIIYGDIKHGRPADMEKFGSVCRELEKKGCEKLILGCTELSLIRRDEHLDDLYIDSLEALAFCTIKRCGKNPVGFPGYFEAEI